jgi:hypothetical protein
VADHLATNGLQDKLMLGSRRRDDTAAAVYVENNYQGLGTFFVCEY